MKKFYLILVIQFLFCWSLTAQEDGLSETEKAAIGKMKELMRTRQKELIAEHIAYPFYREAYFDYVIQNTQEFLEVFDRIFDEKKIEQFCLSEWSDYRHPLTEERSLCGNNGKFYAMLSPKNELIITRSTHSDSEKQYLETLIEKDRQQLHESLRGYEEPVWIVYAGKYRIRIDRMPNGKLRYASWNKDKPISAPADLVIIGGEYGGARWGDSYTFKNGEYTYIVWSNVIGPADGPFEALKVFKGDKRILYYTDDNVIVKEFGRYYMGIQLLSSIKC